jgi:hypothetical protein
MKRLNWSVYLFQKRQSNYFYLYLGWAEFTESLNSATYLQKGKTYKLDLFSHLILI